MKIKNGNHDISSAFFVFRNFFFNFHQFVAKFVTHHLFLCCESSCCCFFLVCVYALLSVRPNAIFQANCNNVITLTLLYVTFDKGNTQWNRFSLICWPFSFSFSSILFFLLSESIYCSTWLLLLLLCIQFFFFFEIMKLFVWRGLRPWWILFIDSNCVLKIVSSELLFD